MEHLEWSKGFVTLSIRGIEHLKVRNEGNQMEVSGTLNSKQTWNI